MLLNMYLDNGDIPIDWKNENIELICKKRKPDKLQANNTASTLIQAAH